ncbi:MAG: metallophosphoesterase, partial [Candidatus Aminicenantaceae bacterium]
MFAPLILNTARLRCRSALFIIALCLAAATGCSHVKPFYREAPASLNQPAPSPDAIRYRLLLLGDAGAPREDEPNLSLLMQWAQEVPARTMVIFLGDNVYSDGMPPPDTPERTERERRLQAQIDVIRDSGAEGFFLAGNHDWEQDLAGLRRQADLIQAQLGRDDAFLPQPGCVGPVMLDREHLRIIALDTDIWLNPRLDPSGECSHKDLEESLNELKDLLRTAGERHVVVVGHHPLDTHGIHGGFYDWKDHLFPLRAVKSWMWLPLPIIGSLYPLLRWNVRKHYEELNSDTYRDMIRRFGEVFSIKKPLLNAGGHDHSLQVMVGDSVGYILVSGAGIDSQLSTVTDRENTLFAHLHTGFMAVDFLEDGSVWLSVVEPRPTEVVFHLRLDLRNVTRFGFSL